MSVKRTFTVMIQRGCLFNNLIILLCIKLNWVNYYLLIIAHRLNSILQKRFFFGDCIVIPFLNKQALYNIMEIIAIA